VVVAKAGRSDGGAANVLMSDFLLSVYPREKYFRNGTMFI
jgi:hypothetical protein